MPLLKGLKVGVAICPKTVTLLNNKIAIWYFISIPLGTFHKVFLTHFLH